MKYINVLLLLHEFACILLLVKSLQDSSWFSPKTEDKITVTTRKLSGWSILLYKDRKKHNLSEFIKPGCNNQRFNVWRYIYLKHRIAGLQLFWVQFAIQRQVYWSRSLYNNITCLHGFSFFRCYLLENFSSSASNARRLLYIYSCLQLPEWSYLQNKHILYEQHHKCHSLQVFVRSSFHSFSRHFSKATYNWGKQAIHH